MTQMTGDPIKPVYTDPTNPDIKVGSGALPYGQPGGPSYPGEGQAGMANPAYSWDIVGGPGVSPSMPNEADYMPGGKWYGFMAYSTALQHYDAALDAFKNGYWYHANGTQWTQAEERHNNQLAKSRDFRTNTGMPTGNLTKASNYYSSTGWEYKFVDGAWRQVSTGTGGGGSTGSGGGAGGSGGSGSGAGGPGSGGGYGGTAGLEGLDKYDRDAAEAVINLFKTYGLDTLAPTVVDMIRRGMGEAAIVASLRETKEYKERFPGMESLRKQGYNAITESQYLQLEDSYHQALQGAGMPKGFYDEPGDFVKFISNGVDPGELKQRATAAVDLVAQVDPAQRELLASMYGVGNGDIAAYFLDPKKAMPILQRQLSAVQIGSAARHAGVQADFANRGRFERLVDNGIGVDEAKQGYTQIAGEMDPLKNLASIWGQGSWSLDDAENAQFFGDAGARKKRSRIVNSERAAFSGASGFDSRVSGRGSSAGSF